MMRDPALPDVTRTVSLAGPGVLTGAGRVVLMASICLLFAMPLTLIVQSDLEDGYGLAQALWRPEHRNLAIASGVTVLLVLAALVAYVVRLPRSITRREVLADAGGLEIVEHPRWWYAGHRGRIDWDDVQVISAQERAFSMGTRGSPMQGNALDLYLFHDVPGLPPFAASTPAEEMDAEIHGVRVPAHRVSLGGPGKQPSDEVGALAEALGALRPGLFYSGAQIDQWYIPPRSAATEPDGRPSGPDRAEGPEPTSAVLPRPDSPVWLDYGHSFLGMVAAVVAQVAVMAGCWYLMNNPFGWGTVPAGLFAFLFVVPFLFCFVTLPASLWLMPRFTAGIGVLVTTEGLEFVRKRPWLVRSTVRTTVAWDWVQAVVARDAPHVANRTKRRGRVVGVYLFENRHDPTVIPGVGVDVTLTHHDRPDAAGTADLAHFPATRLRLTYRHDIEPKGQQLWADLRRGGPSPDTLPSHQLRPTLLAFRPDLCHGFDDLWQGVSRRTPLAATHTR